MFCCFVQVTCGQTYFGSTTDLPIGGRASDSLLVGDCVDNYGGAPAATLYDGVWYKISTGADTFELTLDTCQNSNYDSALSLLSGAGCSEVNPDEMNCVGNNDDRYHNYNGGCALIAVIGPDSPSEDCKYQKEQNYLSAVPFRFFISHHHPVTPPTQK